MQKALAEYAQHSRRGLAEIINQKAYSVLLKAAAQNRVADRARIISELGQQATAIRGQKIKVLKSGKIRPGALLREKIYGSALYAIVRWRAAKKGRQIAASEMEAEAKRELGRRLSAVAFMKSGWFAALGRIGGAIGKPLIAGNARRSGKGFGGSEPAQPLGSRFRTRFWNSSFDLPGNTSDPARGSGWAEQALEKGMMQETANMRQRTAQKLEAMARRQGSR